MKRALKKIAGFERGVAIIVESVVSVLFFSSVL